jgi:hypothetical protein
VLEQTVTITQIITQSKAIDRSGECRSTHEEAGEGRAEKLKRGIPEDDGSDGEPATAQLGERPGGPNTPPPRHGVDVPRRGEPCGVAANQPRGASAMDGSRVAEEEPGDAVDDSPIASRSAGCPRTTDPVGNQRRLNSGIDREAPVRRRHTGSMCRIEGSHVGLRRTSHEGHQRWMEARWRRRNQAMRRPIRQLRET